MVMGWISLLARCKPLDGEWNKDIKSKCYPREIVNGFASSNTGKYLTSSYKFQGVFSWGNDVNVLSTLAFNIFTDIAFATLPIPMIW